MLQASDESPVEYLVHNEAEARKYVRLLMKLMGNLTSDTRAQHFAVSRYACRAILLLVLLVITITSLLCVVLLFRYRVFITR